MSDFLPSFLFSAVLRAGFARHASSVRVGLNVREAAHYVNGHYSWCLVKGVRGRSQTLELQLSFYEFQQASQRVGGGTDAPVNVPSCTLTPACLVTWTRTPRMQDY